MRQSGLAKRGRWEVQDLALLFPIQWQALEPLQTLGGKFQRLPAGHDGLDNVGRKECQWEESAKLVGGKTPIEGDVVDT